MSGAEDTGARAAARVFAGELDGGVHRFRLRVYYEDTDAAGIVYHANYLCFAERARTEMLRLAGIGQSRLRETEGLVFAVRDCAVDYRRPARLDDLLEVRSRLVAMSRVQFRLEQRILDAEEGGVFAVLNLRVACLDRNGRAARVPARLVEALEPYCQTVE